MNPRGPCALLLVWIYETEFLKTMLATHYVACFVFLCLDVLSEDKRVLAFPKICRFDTASSLKLLACKIEKVILLIMVRFYPGRACHHLYRVKTYQLRQLLRLYRTNICESNNKMVLVNTSLSSCTRNGDNVGLIIKNGIN